MTELRNKGAYDPKVSYQVGDVVAFDGSAYRCVQPVSGVSPKANVRFDVWKRLNQELTQAVQLMVSGGVDEVARERIDRLSEENDVLDIPKVFISGAVPTDKYNKTEVFAEMQYISKTDTFHAYIGIKLQGSSSLWYSKLNYTVKLYSDAERETKLKKEFRGWGHKTNKYVLKANFIDHSHARNIVSARLWAEVVSSRSDYNSLPAELRESPRNGAIDGFPVKLYYNGTYQGIYTWNIGKDDWMWGMDEDNPNHVLLCGETNDNGKYATKSSSFRALWSGVDGDDWSIEVGTNSDAVKNSLNALISCVMNTTDAEFKSTIRNYLDINAALDYYLFSYVTCGIDSLAKNMLLGTYDLVKWIPGQYDMDSTYGSHVGGSLNVPANRKCPEEYQERYSLLWERIAKLYAAELKARYSELRNTVLSVPNMFTHFERFMDIIGADLYAEDLTIYPDIPSGDTNNIAQIRDFIRDRLAYVDEAVQNLGEKIETVSGLELLNCVQADGKLYLLSRAFSFVTREGVIPYGLSVNLTDEKYQNAYPVKIPKNAARISVVSPSAQVWFQFFNYAPGSTVYTKQPRFRASEAAENGVEYDIEPGQFQYVAIHLERETAFPDDYDWSKVSVSFVTEDAGHTLFELADKTFAGTEYVETDVQLFDTAKDFTLLVNAEPAQQTSVAATLFHCLDGDIQGTGIVFTGVGDKNSFSVRGFNTTLGNNWSAQWANMKKAAFVYRNGIPVIGKILNTDNSVIAFEFTADNAYTKITRPLLIGAHRTNAGGYSGYWKGTIRDFVVYDFAMDELGVDAYFSE